MKLILRHFGLDPQLSAALRSSSFHQQIRRELENNYHLLAMTNTGQARPEAEASFVALIPISLANELDRRASFKFSDVLQQCLRVVSVPRNRDLTHLEQLKFVDFMNVLTGEVEKRELDLRDAEMFGKLVAQYLFSSMIPNDRRTEAHG